MIVADTSLLIEHLRGNKGATRFLKAQDLVIVPSLAAWELWKGAATVAQQAAVRDLLATCDIDPFSAAHAEAAGALHRQAERDGRRRPAFDLLIAAHAMHHGTAVATLDGDYDGIAGLKVAKVRA